MQIFFFIYKSCRFVVFLKAKFCSWLMPEVSHPKWKKKTKQTKKASQLSDQHKRMSLGDMLNIWSNESCRKPFLLSGVHSIVVTWNCSLGSCGMEMLLLFGRIPSIMDASKPKTCQPALSFGRNDPYRVRVTLKTLETRIMSYFSFLHVTLHAKILVQEHDSVKLVRKTAKKMNSMSN